MFCLDDVVSALVYRALAFLAEVFVCAFGAPWMIPTWVFAHSPFVQAGSEQCQNPPHTHISLVGYVPC